MLSFHCAHSGAFDYYFGKDTDYCLCITQYRPYIYGFLSSWSVVIAIVTDDGSIDNSFEHIRWKWIHKNLQITPNADRFETIYFSSNKTEVFLTVWKSRELEIEKEEKKKINFIVLFNCPQNRADWNNISLQRCRRHINKNIHQYKSNPFEKC